MKRWVDVALEEGVRFFVTSLGNPSWVVEKAHAVGGIVYHDVTEREMGREGARRRRGRAHRRQPPSRRTRRQARAARGALEELGRSRRAARLRRRRGRRTTSSSRRCAMGYAGVQMGTRFIATTECRPATRYKQAIVDAARGRHRADRADHRGAGGRHQHAVRRADGAPRPAPFGRVDAPRPPESTGCAPSTRSLALAAEAAPRSTGSGSKDFWQAGKSVDGITSIEPAGDIVRRFAEAADRAISP